MNNEFRTSDSDLSTYLLILGYKISYIEVTIDKRHDNKLKAFIHFDGEMSELINIQSKCKLGEIKINLKDFSINRQQINKIIKNKLSEYKQNNNK